jgi:hypothetical protein
VITIPGGSRIARATILWNRAGQFSESDITQLPASTFFADRYELGVQRIDVNQDGLPDLVLVGTRQSTYAGWFVQILVNRGNRQFVDETAARIPQGEAGRATGPGAFVVHQLDFNHDGAPDFYVEFVGPGLSQDLPLIWLNDGTGKFSTLKVEDFVTAADAFRIGASPHLVETANGYSFMTTNALSAGLRVIGLLASKPYRTTPTILPGGFIRSDNGQLRLAYQTDGNLVLNDVRNGTTLWATNTGGTRPGRVYMQPDGNFVVSDADGVTRWASDTGGNPNAYLRVQDDGDLVIFRTDGRDVWHRTP